MHIEKRRFDTFMAKYKKGKFGNQRLGQAFYNEFDLHKSSNAGFERLYEMDDATSEVHFAGV